MSIQTLKDRLPDYAKDLRLNLSTLAGETVLTEQQKAGTFIAAALASRNVDVFRQSMTSSLEISIRLPTRRSKPRPPSWA